MSDTIKFQTFIPTPFLKIMTEIGALLSLYQDQTKKNGLFYFLIFVRVSFMS